MNFLLRLALYPVFAALLAMGMYPRVFQADKDGWYPAPPVPVRVDGAVSGFYSGSVTSSSTQTLVHDWFTQRLLDYQYSPLATRREPDLVAEDLAARQAARLVLGHATTAVVETPDLATGTSSGLAVTLALVDAATAGSLLPNGEDVGVTGTITPDGKVGMIGGADAKATGMTQAGLHLFLVPVSNAPEIGAHTGLTVVPVGSVRQAIKVLCALGAQDAACQMVARKR